MAFRNTSKHQTGGGSLACQMLLHQCIVVQLSSSTVSFHSLTSTASFIGFFSVEDLFNSTGTVSFKVSYKAPHEKTVWCLPSKYTGIIRAVLFSRELHIKFFITLLCCLDLSRHRSTSETQYLRPCAWTEGNRRKRPTWQWYRVGNYRTVQMLALEKSKAGQEETQNNSNKNWDLS